MGTKKLDKIIGKDYSDSFAKKLAKETPKAHRIIKRGIKVVENWRSKSYAQKLARRKAIA